MPSIPKPQLREPATSWSKVFEAMFEGLVPNARRILITLGYYSDHDLSVPDQESELSQGEREALEPVAGILTGAAVESEMMPDGIIASTLDKVAKRPSLFFSCDLPAAVVNEIAANYTRGDEEAGTHALDVWSEEGIVSNYAFEVATEANIAKAAKSAFYRIKRRLSRGAPENRANRVIAEGLGKVFRESGHSIVRRREPSRMYEGKIIYVEKSAFHDFLELVLPPLQRHLLERGLAPVTIDSVVRLAIEEG